MNQGQQVIHHEYGKAVVVSYLKEVREDGEIVQTRGVQLQLSTDEGKAKYARDRDGSLPYLFESNFSKIK